MLLFLLLACGVTGTEAEEPLFPFVISYDAPDNVTNVSAWIERPAGKHGFVRAEDGRLVTDAGPIRFWAMNLCFDACFPSREQADMVAARMARLGINCVRMHHMDARSIWGSSPNKLTIDPAQLDRLDYLVHKLKQHGIYTNINLHVSRWLGDKEGFSARDGRPKYDKGIGNFEPRMIEAQKKYARDLLAHVNPYTKTSYADEPAVAFVEISNEDALYNIFNRRDLDDLAEPYATTYRELWNKWLVKKYGSTEKLRSAWKAGEWPLGPEMLTNGDFSSGTTKAWNLERDSETVVQWSVENSGPNNGPALRIVLTKNGQVAWHPQLSQSGFSVKKDTPYTLVFQARSDDAESLGVNCMMSHEPWQRLGLYSNTKIGPDWKEHRFTFLSDRDDQRARITFTSFRPGTYELAAVSLRPGGIVGLEKSQRLEDSSVPILRRGELNLTKAARADFADFLWDTERDYWWGMYRFLKDDLAVRSLVSGTQLTYGPTHIQAGLDYIDAHSYWNHPVFPGRPWDSRNWYVRNIALVNTPGGTLAGLAVRRVAGMAYTVSEYNHPAPNYYAAEGFPMIAAFGAFHRWDGIFPFTYSHDDKFQPRYIANYFDVQSNTTRLAHMPACAALFLRGDVAEARRTILAGLAPELEREKLRQTLSPRSLTADNLGLDPRLSLLHAMAVDLNGKETDDVPELPEDAKVFVSDTGQLRWDISQEGAGYFTVDTSRAKLFTGFVGGRTFELGRVSIEIGPTRLDWATISMVAIDGDSFDSPGRILVAATGWSQNTGVVPEEVGTDRITLGNRWGDEPILCEGIPASIQLPVEADRVTFYPLDESGNRREAVPVKDLNGRASLPLSPEQKTVWYEVEIVK
jgi:carbohydrate binding protein with CBM4/9 domain/cellulase (glycosyl hydrolase family 5)